MLKTRIIPTILFKNNNAIRGKKFEKWRVSGNLLQTIRLYSVRNVDEIIFLDTEATNNNSINFKAIDHFADECFMPIIVGGGIKSIENIKDVMAVGADRVAINTAAFKNLNFIKEAIKYFGKQTIVVSVDYKKIKNKEMVFINSGTKNTNVELKNYLKELNKIDVGEILITSIDHDGCMNGFDIKVLKHVKKLIDNNIIVSGGAGSEKDFLEVILKAKINAISASSIFTYRQITPMTVKKFLKKNKIKVRI